MQKVLCVLAGAVMAAGCLSAGSAAGRSPVLGAPVQALIAAAEGQRIEFFDGNGEPMKELSPGQPGSVSIHNRDETGQDNYTFDENGIVVRRQRSVGDNYARGVWEEMR